MRRFSKTILVVSTALIMMMGTFLNGIETLAAPEIIATAHGTVSKGTTANLLCLYNTSEGLYKIKIDSDTDVSDCKILSVGKAVSVELVRGNDGYLHAASIRSSAKSNYVSVDTNNSTTVTGKVLESSTESIMVLETAQGEMQIKLDPTTDVTGSRFIVSGMKARVVVARGDDAYMHAISVADADYTADIATTGSTSFSYDVVNNSSQTVVAPEGTTAVTGNPQDASTYKMLYLKTDSGVMQIAIDEDTDTSGGFVFTSANELTAYVYRGNDAVMHAKKITGKKAEVAESGSASTTFTGTVSSSSTEDQLVVLTSGGTMKFKIDANTVLKGGSGVLKGKAITISATSGKDNYWHAVTLTVK